MLTELWEKQGRPKTLVVDGKTFTKFLEFLVTTNECQDYVPIEFNGSKVVCEGN